MPTLAGLYGETPAPEGWERLPIEPYSFIDNFIFRCDRVSWGAIERPAFVLWELHESYDAPDSCRKDGLAHRIIATNWFSDAALVEQAKGFGLPAYLGTFNLTKEDLNGVRTYEWRWAAEGQGESSLAFHDNGTAGSDEFPTGFRFFWFTESGVSFLDLEMVTNVNRASDQTVSGTMSSPMLYANAGNPVYAGNGIPAFEAHFSGTIHRFSDLQCAQPIAS